MVPLAGALSGYRAPRSQSRTHRGATDATCDHAEDLCSAAVIQPLRSRHGRGALRDRVDVSVCRAGTGGRRTAKLMNTINDVREQKGLLLKGGTLVDATLIQAALSTKNRKKARDLKMHQTKRGTQWYFGMKVHVGADANSGSATETWPRAVQVFYLDRAGQPVPQAAGPVILLRSQTAGSCMTLSDLFTAFYRDRYFSPGLALFRAFLGRPL